MPNFFEFFAGGGMARAGFGQGWNCLFANDFDQMKGKTYSNNWGEGHLIVEDVAKLTTESLPGLADLVWASFPCQDLSLAGAGAGIRAERSGTFWPFWNLMRGLVKEGRGPRIIVLENVIGALHSHSGKDFVAICSALSGVNYRFGAVVIDAADFVPQSRPRLFIIGVRSDIQIPKDLISPDPMNKWHPKAMLGTFGLMSKAAARKWVWWSLPTPTSRQKNLNDIIEDEPTGVSWHTQKETKRLLSMMSEVNAAKVRAAKKAGTRMVGGVYRRTRNGEQRAEVRFDGVAGCLRTPSGGSSRQTILIIDGQRVRSRLLSPREAARLMGLPDEYQLPSKYNDAYHLAGDGVAVPVVRYLAEHLFEPILEETLAARNAA